MYRVIDSGAFLTCALPNCRWCSARYLERTKPPRQYECSMSYCRTVLGRIILKLNRHSGAHSTDIPRGVLSGTVKHSYRLHVPFVNQKR